ncbi:MAG: methionine--tRNA ligase, partial [Acidobacteria bacterium]|nr:methionine--tRNA ligase [Acidobacteriota bacterium]
FLVTGTDEHGQHVERAVKATGLSPREFTDRVAGAFRAQWDELGIAYDSFIRTTSPQHHRAVQWLFDRCRKNGYIYKGEYTGQYCVNCELYVNDAGPGDPCPNCGRPTETVTEENFFFKLSAFESRLLKLYETGFVQPETRRNEVESFVRQGLRDLSITRTSITWGIPVPGESRHVFYVWFDALIAYMSGIGFGGDPEQVARAEKLWPADLHLIGKEIVRFHAVYWPAFLWAAGRPIPKRVFAHGWLLFEQEKMSKSLGNIVRPSPIARVVGIEGLRYYLLRDIAFGQDGNFSYDALVTRYNSDLANGLGNLASRTLTMIAKYCDGAVPNPGDGAQPAIARLAREAIAQSGAFFENFEFSRALESIWSVQAAVDKYIVEHKPWELAERSDPESKERLRQVLYTAAEALRICAALLYPVLPVSAEKIWRQLGESSSPAAQRLDALDWGQLRPGQKIGKIEGVFPRLDKAEAIQKMRELEEHVAQEQAALMGKEMPGKKEAPPAKAEASAADHKISIDDFASVDMRVGLVKSAERVKGADKLLHMVVDIGEPEPRSIVAGIAQAYTPEQMVGRKVVIVANLQPRKLRGIESNGMIVAASLESGAPVLAGFLEDVPVGSRLK